MEILNTKPDRTVASLIHISTFSKYIIPFGNFILPLILWSAKKNDALVNEHGKQALNFQISIFLYFVVLVFIGISGVIILGMDVFQNTAFLNNEDPRYWLQSSHSIPIILLIGVIGLIMLGLFILEIIAVIKASIKASEGELYQYPLTINFIKPTPVDIHQSKNEQFNNTQNETL